MQLQACPTGRLFYSYLLFLGGKVFLLRKLWNCQILQWVRERPKHQRQQKENKLKKL